MSVRVPLPVRLLQSSLARSVSPGAAHPSQSAAPSPTPLLFLYKPTGLPLFSASQVTSVASADHDDTTETRRLLRAAADVRPAPEDASDSLLARLEDAVAPGTLTYLGLNPLSPPLLPLPSAPQLLAREKGLVVLATSQADAYFLRNAEQLGLVRHRFHVLCHLPDGVSANAQAHTRLRASVRSTRRSTLRNPYLRDYLERTPAAGVADDWAYGVPLWHPHTRHVPASVASLCAARGARGEGLFDGPRAVLRRQGRLRATVGLVTEAAAAAAPHATTTSPQARLSRLFSPASATRALAEGAVPAPSTVPHPWLASSEPILAVLREESDQTQRQGRRLWSNRDRAARHVALDFTLLSVSDQPGNALALYEVSGHATAEEVRALFHAEGCTVLNDFTRDVAQAQAMKDAADAVHRLAKAPSSGVALLPARTQHQLFHASPETLVWQPLVSLSTGAADRAALLSSRLADLDAPASELCERVRRFLQTPASSPTRARTAEVTPRALLWAALDHAVRAGGQTGRASDAVVSHHALARLLMLSLGSGVECCGVTLPDPAHAANILAMQHMVNQRNSPRGGIAAHHPAHVTEVGEQMRMVSVDVHTATASATAQYGVAPLFEVELAPSADERDRAEAPRVCGQTCFTYALALQLPGLRGDLPEKASPADALEPTRTEPWAPSLARVLSLTDAPAAFSALLAAWHHAPTARRPTSPLMLPPASRTTLALSQWLHPPPTLASSTATTATDPLVVRLEEVAELSCAFCGGRGHVWAACELTGPALSLPPQQQREEEAARVSVLPTPLSTPLADTAAPRTAEETFAAQAARTALASSLILRVDDVAAALEKQDSALQQQHEQHATHLAHGGDGGLAQDLVRVPNRRPTAPLNLHALQREQQKPAMHRRTVRCAYCHGRHHITACPQLENGGRLTTSGSARSTGDALTAAELAAVEKSQPAALFCIRCGREGHLFEQCPQLPAGVHPATHCLICLQPQSKSSRPHSPEACPRAVKAPAGFTGSGVATSVLVERAAVARERSERRRTQMRQRRGSMLMADSFVDRQ